MSIAQVCEHRPSEALNAVFPNYDLNTSLGYFQASRNGVSGQDLKQIINIVPNRDLFASVMGESKSNLSRKYRTPKLATNVGESVLDTVRIVMQASDIYDSIDMGMQWLNSPIPALGGEVPLEMITTHAGRELVRQTLRKIEYGEYS